MKMTRYTEEEKTWLRKYIPGHHHIDTAQAFSERFRPITVQQVSNFGKNNGVNTGFRANEGGSSWNKGKPYPRTGRMEETQFKPGNVPPQWRPAGSERVNDDGFIEIKVRDPRTWMTKQRWIWEQANRPCKKDEIVVFLDGNRRNFSLDNLRCVSRRIHGTMNHLHLTYCDAQTFEAACAAAELSLAISAAKKRRKKKCNMQNSRA